MPLPASPAPLSPPPWFDPSLPPLNADHARRAVLAGGAARWRASRHPGLEMRLLEHLPGSDGVPPRISAQLRLADGVDSASLGAPAGIELMVQRGELRSAEERWPERRYLRLPASDAATPDTLALHRRSGSGSGAGSDDAADGALLYLACGQIAASDTERRRIDTLDPECWLPGPVEGTEVLPLHGHSSANVMLIRWLGAVAFRPRLDPLGEEVLVLEGCLHDADGDYPANSWIRNPVPAWQSWAGEPGTVVYYKNGHFATPPDGDSLPFPTATA